MADDIRTLLRSAVPDRTEAPDFATLWDDGRRGRRLRRAATWTSGAAVVAVAAFAAATLLPPGPGTADIADQPGGCPVTIPSEPFVPPDGYPREPAMDGAVWYGTASLWTALDADGDYVHRKSAWWSVDFLGGGQEEQPAIQVTYERLDAPDAPIHTHGPPGTNANTGAEGWFMLAGIDPMEPGCWRVTATYRGTSLSYVYEAQPADVGTGPNSGG